MSRDPEARSTDDAELSALFRTMRDDRAPDDLEEKLLTAVAVGGAAWAVKSGFFATLFAKLFAATKGSTAATVLGLSLAAAGSLAAVQIIATQTAPRPAIDSLPGVAPVVPARAPSPPRAEPVPPVEIAPAVVPPSASAAAPAGPRASAPAREANPRAEPAPRTTELVDPPARSASVEIPAAPPADVLREEATRVRGVADLVAAGRCSDASAAIQAYRAAFPRGQLRREITLLEARCAAPK